MFAKRALVLSLFLPVVGCAGDAVGRTAAQLAEGLAELPVPDRLEALDGIVRAAYEKRLDLLDEALAADGTGGEVRLRLADRFAGVGAWALAYDQSALAAAAFENAVELEPLRAEWHYHRAAAFRQSGKLDAARSSYEEALRLDPLNSEVAVTLAELLVEADEPAKAGALLDSILEIEPNHVVALLRRGEIEAAQERYDSAESLLRRALDLAPEADDVRYALGLSLRDAKDPATAEEARELLQQPSGRARTKKATSPSPWQTQIASLRQGVRTLQRYGRDLYRQGKTAEALRAFDAAIKVAPENPAPHFNRLMALVTLGRFEEAAREHATVASLAPRHRQTALYAGLLALANGDGEAATRGFTKALEIDPSYLAARLELAKSLFRAGLLAEGRRHFTIAAEHHPENTELTFMRIVSESAVGAFDRACAALDRSNNALAPSMALAMARLLAIGPPGCEAAPAEARALARRLYEQDPSIENAESVAMTIAANGNFERAARVQRQILEQARAQSRGLNRSAEIERIAARLESYEQKRMLTRPWTRGELESFGYYPKLAGAASADDS